MRKILFFISFLFLFVLNISAFYNCSTPKPTRSYLHKLLTNANAIISGRIIGILYSGESLAIEELNILPLRVYKGKEYFYKKNEYRSIKVENIMNVEPCPYRLLNSDIRIFVLSIQEDKFMLEAPLIRFSLGILDSLHTLSRGLAHRKRRKTKQTTCEASLCRLGSKCVLKTGTCECKSKCRFAGETVCGSDNVTYASFCHLSVRSCIISKHGKHLNVASKGTCKKRNPCEDLRCGPGEECVVNQDNGILVAKCLCPSQCPNYGDSVESSPVCSSHGVDYQSSCHLRHHACESKTNITVKYYGRCDPCHDFKCGHGLTCQLGIDRKPECRCSEQCPLNLEPVCGTDGKTYTNECMLKLSTCKEQKIVKVWKKGKCDELENPCNNLNCDFGSSCVIQNDNSAICQCPTNCEIVMRPVCAVNGETFDNECEMRKKNCELKIKIDIKHQGTCGVGACATYNSCRKPQVCVAVEGKPKCVCPTCNEELKEVCGSDGRTYSNECKLQQTACLTEKNIFVQYNSVCEGCENKKCDFYSSCVVGPNYKPECKCPIDCPTEESDWHKKEVCGTDGITYSTECHLRKSSCHQKKFIVVAFEGKCDACLNVQCKYGEECRGGKCICSYHCSSNSPDEARICGENGVLYPSMCHLQAASCQKGEPISEMPLTHCHSSKITFPDKCECNRIGSFGHTCDEIGQCKCRPGVSGLKCDHCLPTFWGIHLIAEGALSCRPCGCSVFGSARIDCEQTTGKCECRGGAMGDKCDVCPIGMILTSSGCVQAAEYKTPRDCNSLKCYHGAKCVSSPASFPDCVCPTSCNMNHLGIVENMTVCGSDGTTYTNMCELEMFACKHQIDLVPISMGICDDEHFEILERLQREQQNQQKRLGSFCSENNECKTIGEGAECITRPGRKSVCECVEGWKSQHGTCIQIQTFDDIDKIEFHTNTNLDYYFVPSKMTRKSTINIQIKLDNKKAGTILRLVTDDNKDLEIRHEHRKIVVRIGSHRIESLQSVAYNISLEIKWKRNEFLMKLNGEIQKQQLNGLLDSNVSKIFLASDGKWETNRISATIYHLSIDGKSIKHAEIKPFYLPPIFLRTLKFFSTGFLKFQNLTEDVREKAHFQLIFKPSKANGLLLYWSSSQNDFISFAMIEKKIYFVFDLGSGVSYVKSKPVELNSWITAKIERNDRNFTLFINGKKEKNHIFQGTNHLLDLSKNNFMFVGFVPDQNLISKKIQKLNIPFEGEIQQIRINEFPINLLQGFTDEENKKKIDIVDDDDDDKNECRKMCDGSCFHRKEQIICREIQEDKRGIHINENDQLIYPNNGSFSISSAKNSNFSFEFRTMKEFGIIWFEGSWSQKEIDGDFLIIFIEEKILHIAINLGNDILKPISTNLTVSDNRWHSVHFQRKERKCDIWADGKKILTVVTSPGNNILNTNGLIYLGGPKRHKLLKTLKLTKKFVGCVRNLQIFETKMNLLVDSLSIVEEPKYCFN